MSVNSPEQTLLLNNPFQSVDLYLSIYEPSTVFSCRVTGSYDAANQTITYYGASGDYTDITAYDFLVVLVGTTSGGDEKGRTYIRSATSTQLRFVESAHINWSNGDYITVLDFIEMIPVYPRIIQNPANELDVIFYKFFDVAYTNQNANLGQFVNMGCDFAGFLDPASGLRNVYYSASGTSNLLGQGMSYYWSFEGATVTGSALHTPGNITYDTPGHYKTILTVTNASGTATDRSVRYVSIYDRPEAGTNNPINSFTLRDWGGSRDSGFWRVEVTVHESVPKSKIVDGALIVLFSDEWYGTTKESIGGNMLGRQSIKFVGYIESGSISTDYKSNSVTFMAISPAGMMQLAEGFVVSVESKTSPTTWFQLLQQNMKRAVYHYLKWHSSALLRHDFEFLGTDRDIQFFDSDRESLYDSINSLTWGARFSKVVCSGRGKFWIELDPSVKDNVATTTPIGLDITSNDWIGTPTFDEQTTYDASYIELGGIYFNGATEEFSAHLSEAPGTNPQYRGKHERISGLAVSGQAELNTFSGNLLAWKNSRYPRVDIQLRHGFLNLDIAPIELVRVTLQTSENSRGVSWTNKEFVIESISYQYNSKNKSLVATLSLHEVTQGFAGSTITIPDVPPTDAGSGGGGTFQIPPIVVPPLPGGVGGISIFHNGVFVCIATQINFIDDECA